jgi:hypothetical protein
MKTIDGKSLLETGVNNIFVEVIEFPISDRMCSNGSIGFVSNNQIRVGRNWFDFDNRWIVKVN